MGKVEKVIVLSVLFLVALILVVTVTVDDPLDKTNVVEAGAKKGAPVVAQAPAQPTNAGAPLLNSTVQPQAQPQAGQPQAQPAVTPPAAVVPAQTAPQTPTAQPAVAAAPTLPPGALLKTLDGLQDSWFQELKLYTWKEGDTWRALANTYYGDWQRLDVLKRHNEGRMDVQPGETVFIPVFGDERAMTAAAQAPADAAAPVMAAAAKPDAKTDAKSGTKSNAKGKAEPKTAPKASGKKFHTVASGESLWKIAKAELGDGNRWKEIYEANRDLLDKPESIKKGMRLRIP